MKRLIIPAAFVAIMLGTAGTAQAAPTPTPSPSISLDAKTAEACQKVEKLVADQGDLFAKDMTDAGTKAKAGDLQGAEKSVKQGGTDLVDLSSKLHTLAGEVDNPNLKQALEDVATELNSLGGSLNGITSLQNFDTSRLETLADRIKQICG